MKCSKVTLTEPTKRNYWIVLEFGKNDERRFESIAPYKSKPLALKFARALATHLDAKLDVRGEK